MRVQGHIGDDRCCPGAVYLVMISLVSVQRRLENPFGEQPDHINFSKVFSISNIWLTVPRGEGQDIMDAIAQALQKEEEALHSDDDWRRPDAG